MKKTCSLALKKAVKNCGCERKCTTKKFYGRKVIKKLRTLYWTLDTEDRDQWFSGKFEDFQPSSESTCNQRFTFRISGNVVCQQAWLQEHGITKSSFYRYRTKWQNSNQTGNSKSGQSFSEQKQAAIHWLGEYVAWRKATSSTRSLVAFLNAEERNLYSI
ncbi:MED10 [Mytilus coruscus]|uniref:MED10 n=1 Tax=Mytilus coruscus TaxID=42192 RepID=A0A6J8BXX8_MYTCO|nr:MED10 [Mytilus coruscus]